MHEYEVRELGDKIFDSNKIEKNIKGTMVVCSSCGPTDMYIMGPDSMPAAWMNGILHERVNKKMGEEEHQVRIIVFDMKDPWPKDLITKDTQFWS